VVTTLCKQRGFSRLCEENLCSSNEVMISGREATGEVIIVELVDPWRLTSASSHHPECVRPLLDQASYFSFSHSPRCWIRRIKPADETGSHTSNAY